MIYNIDVSTEKESTITIIGAGIAGSFLAILLAQRGYKIDVYERLPKDEIISTSSKRSFNLTFYGYGVSVLKDVGLWEDIQPHLVTISGSMAQVTENPKVSRFNPAELVQYVIARGQLLEILINKAQQNPLITFHFGTALLAINRQEKTILVQDMKSKQHKTTACDVIFGADGVNSKTRALLQQGQETKHIQEYARWEYKTIELKKELTDKLKLKDNLFYAWTRKYAVFLAHPNKDSSFSALLILPKDPQRGFTSLSSEAQVERFLKENFSDLLPALDNITNSLLENPISHFVTIYTKPWYYKDFIALLGDAAHGFLPFFGQGMSAALEDGMQLAQLVDTYEQDWEKIFSLYQAARKKNTDVLADLSKEIFILYTRHKKADYTAIYYKLEAILHNLFPKIFHPPPFFYIAIDPGHTADHVEKHRRQRRIAKIAGISFMVALITGLVAIQEKLSAIRKKS